MVELALISIACLQIPPLCRGGGGGRGKQMTSALPSNSPINHNFVVFAKSEGTIVQQATTLIQKAERICWNYRLANKK